MRQLWSESYQCSARRLLKKQLAFRNRKLAEMELKLDLEVKLRKKAQEVVLIVDSSHLEKSLSKSIAKLLLYRMIKRLNCYPKLERSLMAGK